MECRVDSNALKWPSVRWMRREKSEAPAQIRDAARNKSQNGRTSSNRQKCGLRDGLTNIQAGPKEQQVFFQQEQQQPRIRISFFTAYSGTAQRIVLLKL